VPVVAILLARASGGGVTLWIALLAVAIVLGTGVLAYRVRGAAGGGGAPPAPAPPPGGTRAGAQPARTRAAGPRASIGRPCWCWGRSSPPHCSPSRWPSPPAAPRPASSR